MAICSQSYSDKGQGAVDLENDGHQRSAMDVQDTDETERAISQRGPGLTQQQKKEAVDYHNKLRRQEGASNMETLVGYVTFVRGQNTMTSGYNKKAVLSQR